MNLSTTEGLKNMIPSYAKIQVEESTTFQSLRALNDMVPCGDKRNPYTRDRVNLIESNPTLMPAPL